MTWTIIDLTIYSEIKYLKNEGRSHPLSSVIGIASSVVTG